MVRETPSLSNDLVYQDVISIARNLHDPDILFLPHDLLHPSLNFNPQASGSFPQPDEGKAFIVQSSTPSTKRIGFRIRLQAKTAAKMLPFEVPLVKALVQQGRLHINEADRMHVAFQEALTNAIDHGCLELNSALRVVEEADGRTEYDRLRETRLGNPVFAQRLIWLSFRITPQFFICRITDSGKGYVSRDELDALTNIERPSGRGLMLMRQFTDRITYNKKNNQVTLMKQLFK